MSTLIGELLIGLKVDDKGIQSGVNRSKKHLTGFQRSTSTISRSVSKSLVGIGLAFSIGGVISSTANTIGTFEQSVANLASTTGKSISQMDAYVNSSIEIGSKSSFSATEVVSLQTELAKLGNSQSEILLMTKAVGDFSVAVGSTAADAATLTGGALKSFNINARDTENVVSSLAVSTTKSALDFNKLNVALPIVGTAADQMGFSLQKTTALLGVLADRNINASTSGTALRNIFIDLKKKGLTYEQAMAQINGSTDKLNTANQLFGKESSVVATVLAESGAAADSLEASITDVDGALQEMTDTRLDTATGKVTLLKSAWEGLVLSVDQGDGVFSNAFKSVVEFATDFVDDLQVLNDSGLDGLIAKGQDNFLKAQREKTLQGLSIANRGRSENSVAGQKSNLEKTLIGLEAALKKTVPESENYNQVLQDIAVTEAKLSKLNFDPFKNVAPGTGTKAAKEVLTYSDQVKLLEGEISSLSEAYVRGGSSSSSLLTTIKEKTTSLVDLNSKLAESEGLISKVFGEGRQVSQPTAIGSTSLPTSLSSNTEQVDTGDGLLQGVIDKHIELGDTIDANSEKSASLGEVMANSASLMAQSLGDSLSQGASSFSEFATSALSSIKKVIGGLIQQYVATYMLEALKGTGILGVIAAPVIGGIAAGLFNTAISSAVPALAEGGVVSGPRIVQVGEYAGASSNPEIIAPEKKLTNIFSSVLMRHGGGDGKLEAELRGSDMLLSNTRESRLRKRKSFV